MPLRSPQPGWQPAKKGESYPTYFPLWWGHLLSVELFAINNQCKVLGVGFRSRAQHDETLEIGTIYPAEIEARGIARLQELAQGVLNEMGLDRGIFHMEVIWTNHGPEVVEINPRIMGGSLPVLFESTYGINPFDLLVSLATSDDDTSLKRSCQPQRASASCLFGSLEQGKIPQDFSCTWLQDEFRKFNPIFESYRAPGEAIRPMSSNFDLIGKLTINGAYPSEVSEARAKILARFKEELNIHLTVPEAFIKIQ